MVDTVTSVFRTGHLAYLHVRRVLLSLRLHHLFRYIHIIHPRFPSSMAHTMSPEEYQELGRRYYKQQQYDKAVEAFTRGIEATGEPTVTQFDQRAASYEKLNDFNAALKDGREMIKRHSEHVKGYLRTASILQKVNKPEKAIDIYKYGMKHVPVDNKDFKV